ncbi:MAG: SCP2 sterol-binding domain-containing protein [Promethearchaeota archaeon]
MLSIHQPLDLISISIYNILSYRKDEEFYNLVKDWNKVIVINIKEFYPVSVIFWGDTIKFEKGERKKADFKVTMGINTMLDVAYRRIGVIKAVLKRKLKIKGIFKISTLLKFQKIFLGAMRKVAEDPNINYYEIEKITR